MCEGEVLAAVRATIYAWYANTTLLESMAVTELVRAVRKELDRQGKVDVQAWLSATKRGRPKPTTRGA